VKRVGRLGPRPGFWPQGQLQGVYSSRDRSARRVIRRPGKAQDLRPAPASTSPKAGSIRLQVAASCSAVRERVRVRLERDRRARSAATATGQPRAPLPLPCPAGHDAPRAWWRTGGVAPDRVNTGSAHCFFARAGLRACVRERGGRTPARDPRACRTGEWGCLFVRRRTPSRRRPIRASGGSARAHQ
jgi:hypothetical protein